MIRTTYSALAACLMTTVLACGCQSAGMITRGQSPVEAENPIVQTGFNPREDVRAKVQAVRDLNYELTDHNTTTFYSDTTNLQETCPAGMCPKQYPGYCPTPPGGGFYGGGAGYGGGGGYCRPGCPHGGCPNCALGNCLDWYPRHNYSWAYQRPNNLCYPAPNSAGGSVVYPYYTHKGPSDFFRTK